MDDLFDICDVASNEQGLVNAPQMPLIGDAAPQFVAQTTNGRIVFPQDYDGKWVVFFSHPADFTPVCTSEFIRFQELKQKFAEINTELLGLSVGSISSHLGWIQAISDMEGGIKINFPIVADTDMKIARAYGMIHDGVSDTSAVRAVFIIDPHGVVRTILYYPAVMGRNFNEIMRIVVGLQTADAFHVVIPADWVPGNDVLAPAPQTVDEMDAGRIDKNRRAWFMTYKPMAADKIYDKLIKKDNKKKK